LNGQGELWGLSVSQLRAEVLIGLSKASNQRDWLTVVAVIGRGILADEAWQMDEPCVYR
jgi:hypothetical protein